MHSWPCVFAHAPRNQAHLARLYLCAMRPVINSTRLVRFIASSYDLWNGKHSPNENGISFHKQTNIIYTCNFRWNDMKCQFFILYALPMPLLMANGEYVCCFKWFFFLFVSCKCKDSKSCIVIHTQCLANHSTHIHLARVWCYALRTTHMNKCRISLTSFRRHKILIRCLWAFDWCNPRA